MTAPFKLSANMRAVRYHIARKSPTTARRANYYGHSSQGCDAGCCTGDQRYLGEYSEDAADVHDAVRLADLEDWGHAAEEVR
jgi:hypothetical protein